jgi:hypothetical protein
MMRGEQEMRAGAKRFLPVRTGPANFSTLLWKESAPACPYSWSNNNNFAKQHAIIVLEGVGANKHFKHYNTTATRI